MFQQNVGHTTSKVNRKYARIVKGWVKAIGLDPVGTA
jgi:hypothetical protein